MRENIFDQVAQKYDTDKQIKLAEVIVKEVKQQLGNSSSKTLLDYGCGTGLVSLELAGEAGSLLLVDSSEQMLEIVENKISQRGITNSKVIHSDFIEDTLNVKVDIILLSLVLLHISDTKKILEALFDKLNDGGKLIVVDFDKNDQVSNPKVHNGFSHEVLQKLLAEIGFKSAEIKTFHYGERLFMNQDASMFIAVGMK